MSMCFQLIKAETKRIFLSPHYLWIPAVLLGIHLIHSTGWIPVFNISWGSEFLDNTILLSILISLSFSAYVLSDFTNKTIYNKIILGFSNTEIFFSMIVSFALAASVLMVMDSLLFLIDEQLQNVKTFVPFASWATNTLIFSCSLVCVAIITGCISFIIPKKKTVFLCVLVAILFVNLGRIHTAELTAYYSLFSETYEETTGEAQDFTENYTVKPSPKLEHTLNAKICISPYAQCYFSSYAPLESLDEKKHHSLFFKEYPFHMEFIIADAIIVATILLTELVLTTTIKRRK